jgi:hypothetical protein
MSVTVTIFGSCVTRDLFEDPLLHPVLGPYFARCSIISAVAPPVALAPERVVISSDWQRRCVLADFHKTFFDSLAQGRPDWLVVDLIDERFDLLRAADSFVTRSSAFQAAALDEAAGLPFEAVHRMSAYGCSLFEEAAPTFAERVTAIVPPERIVLHRALWCTHYRRADEVRAFPPERLELCRRQNAMLTSGYDALERALGPDTVRVELHPERQLADAEHRWELEPYHYEPAYNARAGVELRRHFGLA